MPKFLVRAVISCMQLSALGKSYFKAKYAELFHLNFAKQALILADPVCALMLRCCSALLISENCALELSAYFYKKHSANWII